MGGSHKAQGRRHIGLTTLTGAGPGFVLRTRAYVREGTGSWREGGLRDECGFFHPSVSSDEAMSPKNSRNPFLSFLSSCKKT